MPSVTPVMRCCNVCGQQRPCDGELCPHCHYRDGYDENAPEDTPQVATLAIGTPELLEALRDAVRYLDNPPTGWTRDDGVRLERIRKLASSV
jgi:uncharacterized protein (DUF2237 family)